MADWVFDSLVGFLQSPTWSHRVDSFIEHHCVVFDPGEENKFSYTDIHKEYQEMVESLLESFMTDLGITSEQFVEVCSQASGIAETHEHLFEQVMAADNFLIFKAMMVQKNIDLELQALSLLQKQLGHSPEAYQPSTESSEWPPKDRDSGEEDDEKVLGEILQQSEKEYELQQSLDEEEMEKLLTLAKEESLRLYQAAQQEPQQELDETPEKVTQPFESESGGREEERHDAQPPAMVSIKVESGDEKHTAAAKTDVSAPVETQPSTCSSESKPGITKVEAGTPPESESSQHKSSQVSAARRKEEPLLPLSPDRSGSKGKEMSGAEAAALWMESAKSERQHTNSSSDGTSQRVQNPEDLKAREAYLRRQRDHLLAVKRKEKAKQFDSYTAAASHSSKSARVTRSVAKGEVKAERDKGTAAAGEKGGDTGVLCSAIAGRMKKEQIQENH